MRLIIAMAFLSAFICGVSMGQPIGPTFDRTLDCRNPQDAPLCQEIQRDRVKRAPTPNTNVAQPTRPAPSAEQRAKILADEDKRALDSGTAALKKHDYLSAMRIWRPLAERGNADAQYNIAELYILGEGGISRDFTQASIWLNKAVDQYHPRALSRIDYLNRVIAFNEDGDLNSVKPAVQQRLNVASASVSSNKPDSGTDAASSTVAVIIIVFISVYFLPTLIALNRGHHNAAAITLLNLFLGWTFLGWLAALIWASTHVIREAPGAAVISRSRRSGVEMDPIHAGRGKFYCAIKCRNCREVLPLLEVQPRSQTTDVEAQIAGWTVRCPICKSLTEVQATQPYILEVR